MWCVCERPVISMGMSIAWSIGLYAVHCSGHTRTSWGFQRAHQGHHVLYPAYGYSSKKYKLNIFDPYQLNSVCYLGMFSGLFVLFLVLFRQHTNDVLITATIILICMLFENEVHEACHQQDHLLRRIPFPFWTEWFAYLNYAHFIHHKHPRTNFAVVSLWVDDLFGTLSPCCH